ncbi:phosphoglycerate kinase [Mycoplasmopsis gallinarum]|uniref:Phosphoglycerate kinase n=1 Tax=Mycoplasmopsis gallinarum TaxID=29557 RepID=A0A168R6X2_9BACT|nr:phosphoglycerate kinase [Mycoplasmopsis gallinarum]OAB48659.1 Phosphoglycerate kinase [Mycoplasmopsis gallinarum]
MKKHIDDLSLKGKRVLMRVDFNVPMKNGIITSNKRIVASLASIKKVINEGGKLILFSHLGRVKTEEDLASKTLLPVAIELSRLLNKSVTFVNQTRGHELEKAVALMQDGDVILVQNTRYEDLNNKAESKNDPNLGKYWASLGEVFINDAFGTAHRAHASNVGISQNIEESAIGYLVANELNALNKLVNEPQKPFYAIVGGNKISDKILMLEKLIHEVDRMFIGGGMAYTFLKAKGKNIGKSIFEADQLEYAKEFYDKYQDKIWLPIDFKVATKFANDIPVIQEVEISDEYEGLDIGPKTVTKFTNALAKAKTIVWNGPLGVVEFSHYKQGTLDIAKAISSIPNVYSVIGGGDSAAAIINAGMENEFSHISTGGGATLEFLKGAELPAIVAIQDKK